MKEFVKRFASLFRGNDRSYGVWIPDTTKMMTEKKKVTEQQYAAHLSGERGLGLVPIMDSSTCWFGAIDIDNHGQMEDIDLNSVRKKIKEKKLPLVACRSKSGGIHAYVFCREPVRASLLRVAMGKWASEIGFPSAELFPKQDYLDTEVDGERRLGNWINLCYFNGNDGNRYALDDSGNKATLEWFLNTAEASRIPPEAVSEAVDSAHSGAPPCIQRLLSEGVPSGARNEALYNITVYLKRANPNTYLDDALDINSTVFESPLPTAEAKRTIKSASRRDYKYRCSIEPLKSLCNSSVCVKREFGITPNEFNEMEAEYSLPNFSGVIKYSTDPVKWGLCITKKDHNGDTVEVIVNNLPTEVLYNFEALRMRITEVLTIGVPSITKRNWERRLLPMIAGCRLFELPRDASVSGIIVSRLKEFLDKVNFNVQDEQKEREKILRGIPCVMDVSHSPDGKSSNHIRAIVFRGMDFMKYLKSVKSEEVKGSNLWFILNNVSDFPVHHTRISVNNKKMSVWYVPLDNYSRADHPAPNITTEF